MHAESYVRRGEPGPKRNVFLDAGVRVSLEGATTR